MPRSERYRVKILENGESVVEAWMPESINFSVESEWSAPFVKTAGLVDAATATFIKHTLITKSLSSEVWSGSSPISITLPLEFAAEQNALYEVMLPIWRLMKMTLPGVHLRGNAEFLAPPGPNIIENAVDIGTRITVEVGDFLRFSNVIVTNISTDIPTKILEDGYPSRAKVEVQFRTSTTVTKTDLDQIFKGVSSASAQ